MPSNCDVRIHTNALLEFDASAVRWEPVLLLDARINQTQIVHDSIHFLYALPILRYRHSIVLGFRSVRERNTAPFRACIRSMMKYNRPTLFSAHQLICAPEQLHV